ncbi:MAG: type II secretion system protein [Phycisphaeraceae bacterium]|nr:type II secretion system protein [Phycisphaeraceae bacterium]
MRRGFTLFEMMAVVVLLGLVAAMLAVGLGGTAQATAWQGAIAEVRQFDRLVRLEARAHGSAELIVDNAGDALVLRRPGSEVAKVLRSRDFESFGFVLDGNPSTAKRGFSLTMSDASSHGERRARSSGDARVLDRVFIDGAGRSIDFAYELSDGKEVSRIHVAGLTGHLWEERE